MSDGDISTRCNSLFTFEVSQASETTIVSVVVRRCVLYISDTPYVDEM